MRRRGPAFGGLLTLALTGCHRVTGVAGYGAEFRHGQGYDVASQVIWWAAVAAMVAGIGFLISGAVERRRTGAWKGEQLVWGPSLLTVGALAWLVTTLFSLGLWICHGSC